MEDSVLQRISEFINKSNLSITGLSKKIGISQPTLHYQMRGERTLSLATVSALLDCFPEISAEWLLRGKGEMILPSGSSVAVSDSSNTVVGNHNTGNNAGGLSESFVKSLLDEKDKQINQLLQIVSNLNNR